MTLELGKSQKKFEFLHGEILEYLEEIVGRNINIRCKPGECLEKRGERALKKAVLS